MGTWRRSESTREEFFYKIYRAQRSYLTDYMWNNGTRRDAFTALLVESSIDVASSRIKRIGGYYMLPWGVHAMLVTLHRLGLRTCAARSV